MIDTKIYAYFHFLRSTHELMTKWLFLKYAFYLVLLNSIASILLHILITANIQIQQLNSVTVEPVIMKPPNNKSLFTMNTI